LHSHDLILPRTAVMARTIFVLLAWFVGVTWSFVPCLVHSNRSPVALFSSIKKGVPLTASQRARRDEEKRREERKNEVVPGKTSAIPGEKDFEINPSETEREWLKYASSNEKEIFLQTEKGLDCLRRMDFESATTAFDRVFELNPHAYLWQAGIPFFYQGDYKRASEIFARSILIFESRFGELASEERIWRDACELMYLGTLDEPTRESTRENLSHHIEPCPLIDENSDPLSEETRLVVRVAKDFFAATTAQKPVDVAVGRAKLRSLGGPEMGSLRDVKMFKLMSWYYLGLHYDCIGQPEKGKRCMKVATRFCPDNKKKNDLFFQLPFIHMTKRKWIDDNDNDDDDDDADPKEDPIITDHVKNILSRVSDYGKTANPILIASLQDSISGLSMTDIQAALREHGLEDSYGTKEQLADNLVLDLLLSLDSDIY